MQEITVHEPVLAATAALASFAAEHTCYRPDQPFPEGAELLTPEALREALSGKVFSISPAQGPTWRWQFDANGYFFLNVGQFSNSGKWSTKEGSVCQDTGKHIGCNEMR